MLPRSVWRAPGPVLQGLLAFAVYLAAFAWYAVPLIRYLNQPVVGHGSPDANFYVWVLRWLPYAVSHGVNPLYSNQIMAPGGIDLSWSTPAATMIAVMWPATAWFGPVVAYNLTLVLVPPATAWAAFAAARRLTGRFWASLLAGAVFGFCPFMVMHDVRGDLNLTANILFPLMVYLVLLWRDGTLGRTGFVIWMTAALALQFYTFTEYFADLTVVLAAALLIGYAVAGRDSRPAVARLARLTAVAYAGALALASPYLVYALRRYPSELSRQQPGYSLRMVRLVLPQYGQVPGLRPPAGLAAYSNGLGGAATDDYVGIPLLLILLLLAVFTWKSRITRLLVLTFLVVIAIAAGPDLVLTGRPLFALPWSGLWSLPVARSAEPLRLIIFGFLILAMAMARWLAAPAAGRLARVARWTLGLLALAAILADTPAFTPTADPPPRPQAAVTSPAGALPPFITANLYRHYLTPGEIVAVVSQRGNAGMLFQASTGFYFRVAGGYINMSLSGQFPPAVAALADPTPAAVHQFQDYLRQAGVGAVLVEQTWAEPWMNIFTRIGMHGTSVGGITVYPAGSSGTARIGLTDSAK